MIKTKRVISIVLIMFTLTLVILLVTRRIVIGYEVSPNNYYIEDIKISGQRVHISGGTVDSFNGFTGYTFKISNNALFVNPKYLPATRFNPSGNFIMNLETGENIIEKIYFVGNNDKKLVWINVEKL